VTTTAAAAVVASDGPVLLNGRGDGVAVAMETTGARQRSVELPSA